MRRDDLPLALARLHATLPPRAVIELKLVNLRACRPTPEELERGESERRLPNGRTISVHGAERAAALLEGAGFEDVQVTSGARRRWLSVHARRAQSLPDLVGPNLRLLICGLNPSLYSANVGIPFARPGNRFWPAARAAGLIERDRDPLAAFRRGIGMTDLVKRATAGADELRRAEYAAGIARLRTLVRRYRPGAVCFVGLQGWRHAVDRRAQPGWIAGGLDGCPAYLMPSTSGRNARVPLAVLAAHLRAAACRRPPTP